MSHTIFIQISFNLIINHFDMNSNHFNRYVNHSVFVEMRKGASIYRTVGGVCNQVALQAVNAATYTITHL